MRSLVPATIPHTDRTPQTADRWGRGRGRGGAGEEGGRRVERGAVGGKGTIRRWEEIMERLRKGRFGGRRNGERQWGG